MDGAALRWLSCYLLRALRGDIRPLLLFWEGAVLWHHSFHLVISLVYEAIGCTVYSILYSSITSALAGPVHYIIQCLGELR